MQRQRRQQRLWRQKRQHNLTWPCYFYPHLILGTGLIWSGLLTLDLFSKNETLKTELINTPRMINTAGELSTTFAFNGHEVYYSCGVTFRNNYFIFGGETKNRDQILELKDCGLQNIGTLKFSHYYGACGSRGGVIVLCFNLNPEDNKRCRKASSATGEWTELAQSSYEHRETSIAISPGN